MFGFVRNETQTSLAAFIHPPEIATQMSPFSNVSFLTLIQAPGPSFSLWFLNALFAFWTHRLRPSRPVLAGVSWSLSCFTVLGRSFATRSGCRGEPLCSGLNCYPNARRPEGLNRTTSGKKIDERRGEWGCQMEPSALSRGGGSWHRLSGTLMESHGHPGPHLPRWHSRSAALTIAVKVAAALKVKYLGPGRSFSSCSILPADDCRWRPAWWKRFFTTDLGRRLSLLAVTWNAQMWLILPPVILPPLFTSMLPWIPSPSVSRYEIAVHTTLHYVPKVNSLYLQNTIFKVKESTETLLSLMWMLFLPVVAGKRLGNILIPDDGCARKRSAGNRRPGAIQCRRRRGPL